MDEYCLDVNEFSMESFLQSELKIQYQNEVIKDKQLKQHGDEYWNVGNLRGKAEKKIPTSCSSKKVSHPEKQSWHCGKPQCQNYTRFSHAKNSSISK